MLNEYILALQIYLQVEIVQSPVFLHYVFHIFDAVVTQVQVSACARMRSPRLFFVVGVCALCTKRPLEKHVVLMSTHRSSPMFKARASNNGRTSFCLSPLSANRNAVSDGLERSSEPKSVAEGWRPQSASMDFRAERILLWDTSMPRRKQLPLSARKTCRMRAPRPERDHKHTQKSTHYLTDMRDQCICELISKTCIGQF